MRLEDFKKRMAVLNAMKSAEGGGEQQDANDDGENRSPKQGSVPPTEEHAGLAEAKAIREELGGVKPRAEAARRSARSKLKRAVSRVRVTRAIRGSNHVGQEIGRFLHEVEEEHLHEGSMFRHGAGADRAPPADAREALVRFYSRVAPEKLADGGAAVEMILSKFAGRSEQMYVLLERMFPGEHCERPSMAAGAGRRRNRSGTRRVSEEDAAQAVSGN